MAKIILINPNIEYARGVNKATITPPLGLAYLTAVLKKIDRHEVQIIDANILGINAQSIKKSFAFVPDIVGISANIINYRGAIACAKQVKAAYPAVPIIFGGPHSSSIAESVLINNSVVDAVVVGEGEYTFAELVTSLEANDGYAGIKGIVWRHKDRVIRNPSRTLIENIDDLPFPAYHLLPDVRKYKTRGRGWPVGYVITSRGCPNQCTFCNQNIFGNKWRPHSTNRVIAEVDYLVRQYRIRQIDILDDNFTFDKQRAGEILDLLAASGHKLYINLQNGIRLDRTDENLLRRMKRAGVFKIAFGIESADARVQEKTKKYVDLDKAIKLTKFARSLGMVTYGFFILGLLGESPESIARTIAFAIRMNPHFALFSLCIPFPGTELYKEAKNQGILLEGIESSLDAGFYGSKIFFKLDNLDQAQMLYYFRLAYKHFYLRLAKILDITGTLKSARELYWMLEVAYDTLRLGMRRM